jgi:tetratricopeptide (TPR) repeat protein
MSARTGITVLALVALCWAAAKSGSSEPPAGASAPSGAAALAVIEGIDIHPRTVTTASPEAQKLFDGALLMMYAYNHEEAIARFERAAAADSTLAMAYWGKALALGPHINNPSMDEAATKAAVETMEQARRHAAPASPVERQLVDALAFRYSWPVPESRAPLDSAYANAMRNVWKTNPTDADVGALFAESLMMLRPWDQWTPDGAMQPGTQEVLAVLEAVLAKAPNHPLANHLYIHAVEASPNPGRALPSADRLRTLVPGAGHLVHMPGHIDLRLGHYKEAIETNQKGVAADLAYVEQVGRRPGFYAVYRAHNYHFLTDAAMFDGQSKVALQAARDLTREVPLEAVRALPAALDGFWATPYHVMVRFGWWQQILDEPLPPPDLKVTTAFARYSRTIALASLGRVDEAAKEIEAFEKSTTEVPESAYIGNNTALTILGIARRMAKGELAYRQGQIDEGFDHLRDAVRQDDALRYDEPWGWFQPARHALGALLLEQGRVAEAEEVYRKDLELHPDNGWALHGLAECLRKSGDVEEAARTEEKLRASWARADVPITASCFCRRG